MKYVSVNDGSPNGGFALVDDKPTGWQIKYAAIRAGLAYGATDDWQLLGHNANGSSSVIGNADTPWQYDFSMTRIYDNA